MVIQFLKKAFLIVISFLIYYYIHMIYIGSLLLNLGINNFLVYLVIIILGTIIVYEFITILYRSIQSKKIYFTKNEKRTIAIIYMISIIILLLCRMRIDLPYNKLYNLNFLSFFSLDQSNYFRLVYLYNFLIFLPLGYFTEIRIIKFILLVTLIELLQLILKVGFFDINDIILYLIGFLIGRGLKNMIQNIKY